MTDRNDVAGRKRYRIVVRGEFGELLETAFEEMAAQPHLGNTILTADVADASELYGLLDRLRDFAIEVINVEELDPNG